MNISLSLLDILLMKMISHFHQLYLLTKRGLNVNPLRLPETFLRLSEACWALSQRFNVIKDIVFFSAGNLCPDQTTIPALLGVMTLSGPSTPRCRGESHWSRGGIQRSPSNHRQQHITPILKIKTFYLHSESKRIFSIFWFLVGEIWYKLKNKYILAWRGCSKE